MSVVSCQRWAMEVVLAFQSVRSADEGAEVGGEAIDIFGGGIPRAHEPAAALADEGVEEPAFLAEPSLDGRGEFCEDRIGLAGEEDADLGQRFDGVFEAVRHGIGMGSVVEPCSIVQHSDPRSSEEAHF